MGEEFKEQSIDRAITTFIKELHIFMDSSIRIESSSIDNSFVICIVDCDYEFKIPKEVFKRKISSEENIMKFVKEISEKVDENEMNKILTIC